ncbi:MAG: serine hydrolase, partial [Caldisericia bacterium]|nr:serine hydrolase [Caldisericia bacterium]
MNKKMVQLLGIIVSLCLFALSFTPVSLADEKARVPTTEMLALAAEYNRAVGGQTLVVMHQGNVVLEEYTNGGRKDKLMMLASGSKSFSGVVALAAIEDGILKLDDRASTSLT